MEDVISLADVGQMLGERYSTVWGWATGGRIPAHKVGWAWMVKVADVEAIREFAEKQKTYLTMLRQFRGER